MYGLQSLILNNFKKLAKVRHFRGVAVSQNKTVLRQINSYLRFARQVRRQDQFERKNGGGFDAQEFEEHPERYVSNFAHKFAPYASVIINGIYWAPNTPRLLTIPDAKALLTPTYSPWIADSVGKYNL